MRFAFARLELPERLDAFGVLDSCERAFVGGRGAGVAGLAHVAVVLAARGEAGWVSRTP